MIVIYPDQICVGFEACKIGVGAPDQNVSSNDTVCLHHLRLWSTAIEPSVLSEVRVSPPSITCHTLGTRVHPFFETTQMVPQFNIQHWRCCLDLPTFTTIYVGTYVYTYIILYIYECTQRHTHTCTCIYIYNTQSSHDAVFPIPRISRGRPR